MAGSSASTSGGRRRRSSSGRRPERSSIAASSPWRPVPPSPPAGRGSPQLPIASSGAHGSPAAVGISIGGPVDTDRGVVLSPPNLPTWDDVPLAEICRSRFHAPTFLEHDGRAGALAEWLFGAGRGLNSLVFLTFGTGLGAGVIVDGHLLRGAHGAAGEVGRWRIAQRGPRAHGKVGSWEGLASGSGLPRLRSPPPSGERMARRSVRGNPRRACARRRCRRDRYRPRRRTVAGARDLVPDLFSPYPEASSGQPGGPSGSTSSCRRRWRWHGRRPPIGLAHVASWPPASESPSAISLRWRPRSNRG